MPLQAHCGDSSVFGSFISASPCRCASCVKTYGNLRPPRPSFEMPNWQYLFSGAGRVASPRRPLCRPESRTLNYCASTSFRASLNTDNWHLKSVAFLASQPEHEIGRKSLCLESCPSLAAHTSSEDVRRVNNASVTFRSQTISIQRNEI